MPFDIFLARTIKLAQDHLAVPLTSQITVLLAVSLRQRDAYAGHILTQQSPA
jgi:hypothetical protein